MYTGSIHMYMYFMYTGTSCTLYFMYTGSIHMYFMYTGTLVVYTHVLHVHWYTGSIHMYFMYTGTLVVYTCTSLNAEEFSVLLLVSSIIFNVSEFVRLGVQLKQTSDKCPEEFDNKPLTFLFPFHSVCSVDRCVHRRHGYHTMWSSLV